MSGTKSGGLKASATNKARHGETFYQRIGALGGYKGTTGGWAHKTPCDCKLIKGRHTKPQCRGKLGGMNGKRGKAKTNF